MTNWEEEYLMYAAILEPVLREKLCLEQKYVSPIVRPNGEYERTPSFKVFRGGKDGQHDYTDMVFWKDWGGTNQKGNRPVHLIMALHGVDQETAEEMLDTLELPGINGNIPQRRKNKLSIEDREDLNRQELSWWKAYNVTEDTLRHFNVFGVDKVWAGKNVLYEAGRPGKVAFSYRGGEDLELFEVYIPKTYAQKKGFWRRGHFFTGYEQLPYTMDDLIIGAGVKDDLCTYEASGLDCMALGSEGAWKKLEKILPTLRRRAKRIWSLMNPDGPGVVATRAIQKELGVPPFPFKFLDERRDIADLSKTMGLKWLEKRFKEAINRI